MSTQKKALIGWCFFEGPCIQDSTDSTSYNRDYCILLFRIPLHVCNSEVSPNETAGLINVRAWQNPVLLDQTTGAFHGSLATKHALHYSTYTNKLLVVGGKTQRFDIHPENWPWNFLDQSNFLTQTIIPLGISTNGSNLFPWPSTWSFHKHDPYPRSIPFHQSFWLDNPSSSNWATKNNLLLSIIPGSL